MWRYRKLSLGGMDPPSSCLPAPTSLPRPPGRDGPQPSLSLVQAAHRRDTPTPAETSCLFLHFRPHAWRAHKSRAHVGRLIPVALAFFGHRELCGTKYSHKLDKRTRSCHSPPLNAGPCAMCAAHHVRDNTADNNTRALLPRCCYNGLRLRYVYGYVHRLGRLVGLGLVGLGLLGLGEAA